MADPVTLGVGTWALGVATSWATGQVVSVCAKTRSGAALVTRATQVRQRIAGRLSESLRQAPLEPGTNHDLQRLLTLSLRDAGLDWLARLNAVPEHELSQADPSDLAAFDARVRLFIEARGRDAEDRTTPFETVVGEEIMTRVVAAVPEATVATAELKTTCATLATAFRETLEARDGEGLPEAARTQLDRSDADGLNRFGKRVLDSFIERLKSRDHREAARAFDHRVGGEIRSGLQEVREMLAKSDDNVQASLAELDKRANDIDGIALSVARVEQDTAFIRDLLQRTDQRLAARGRLALDRKRAIETDKSSFVQLTFRQRSTRVVGRERELAQLRDFLESDADFAWWQIAGEGGQGKSRLALHLVDELDAAWDAGFIDAEELENFDWKREPFEVPTLCIVDYAAAPQKAANVVKAITALAGRADGSANPQLDAPVRLLVLERVGYAFDERAKGGFNWLRSANADADQSIRLQASVHRKETCTASRRSAGRRRPRRGRNDRGRQFLARIRRKAAARSVPGNAAARHPAGSPLRSGQKLQGLAAFVCDNVREPDRRRACRWRAPCA